MNKSEAQQFLISMYQDILSEMNTEKIPDYFSENYVQVTDGSQIDLVQFKDHMRTLKKVARTITVSPFHEFLFDERLQSAAVRYTVNVVKTNGDRGRIEIIAMFKMNGFKIVQCHELSHAIEGKEDFEELAKISEAAIEKASSREEKAFSQD
ncbi:MULTISPECIES: nuclear transport factor 2 family protein [Bacillus]|uniref:nuclear transport factor 2 family protein n=1 Tax=Bacillus TaxID=1386 RepID=UPI0011A61DED|nr:MULTISPECIES: nuclear transport factor 2 family protein [Bacillus]MCD2367746.1 nuclear transport factor 2 family protein [Bacillus sp. BS3(2021)]MCJ8229139.1 nuclear transport factor 2 family protein [Bacillus paralicheniformis]MCY8039286.1 nuclear transport factor 2 family protein [Bacillus paralicheniformis]MCY8177861.1 nuclear transport factor 2 family protein [Bacillus paralicheniformis]MEC4199726.1 nuclear transport factor 2 family protein [Bacillus sp. AAVF1]